MKREIVVSGFYADADADTPRDSDACPYPSCPQCGGCGVCRDFHGDHYGGCGEDTCPYRWYHRIRDWWRRQAVKGAKG